MSSPIIQSRLHSDRFRRPRDTREQMLGWQFDFLQLDRGPLRIMTSLAAWGDVQIMRSRINRKTDQRGRAPVSRGSFGVLDRNVAPYVWCGQEVTANSLMFFPPGSRLDAIGPAVFDVTVLMLPPPSLLELNARCRGNLSSVLDSTRPVVALESAQHVNHLRSRLGALLSAGRGQAAAAVPVLESLLHDLVPMFQNNRAVGRPVRGSAPRRARIDAMLRGVDYARTHAEDAPRVKDICDAAGMKERTLRHAFLEHVGMSPKAYLQALRLEEVRNALIDPLGNPCISDVANQWGFWHLGQFAADYRARFGELPSVTLARSRSGGAAKA